VIYGLELGLVGLGIGFGLGLIANVSLSLHEIITLWIEMMSLLLCVCYTAGNYEPEVVSAVW